MLFSPDSINFYNRLGIAAKLAALLRNTETKMRQYETMSGHKTSCYVLADTEKSSINFLSELTAIGFIKYPAAPISMAFFMSFLSLR